MGRDPVARTLLALMVPFLLLLGLAGHLSDPWATVCDAVAIVYFIVAAVLTDRLRKRSPIVPVSVGKQMIGVGLLVASLLAIGSLYYLAVRR